MSTAYFTLGSRMRQRQQRLRQERRAKSGQAAARRHLTPALSPSEAEREKQTPSLSTLNSSALNFAFTARSRDEAKGGRDTQATGKVTAANAEAAREKVRQAYRFADHITVTPLPA